MVKNLQICFVLDHRLMHYRVPLFNRLSEWPNVIVIHRGPELAGAHRFSQKVVKYWNVGPFDIPQFKVATDVDVLVVMQNLRLVQSWVCVARQSG